MGRIESLKDISYYKDWKTIKKVNKGWSEDEKFFIVDKLGNKLLLRLSDISFYERKKSEFENLKLVFEQEINMSMPIDFGICDNGSKVYLLFTWLEGEDGLDILPTLNKHRQYELGVEAGKILRRIHIIRLLETIEPWEKTYKGKINAVIEAYKQCGHKIQNEQEIIKFIYNNKKHLKSRPITFQHGDYHIGNMVITPEGNLGIIDFNRSSFGDPWEEYDRFVFTWSESTYFANGQIHGYFNNNVPDDFFRLMALYSARNLIASIPWSLRFGEKELKTAIENINKVNKAYDGFKTYIPSWYVEP